MRSGKSLFSVTFLLVWLLLFGGANARETREPGFIASYIPPETATYKPIYELMMEAKILETTAEVLNQLFIFPRDINLAAAELGTVNAFYSPEHNTVVVSYELLAHFLEQFVTSDNPEHGAQMAAGAFCFVLFHELGHCLIHQLELPTVGKEEDAVDEFATLLLLESGETGELAILSAATWFATHRQGNDTTPFWDEHSLDMQRFFGIFTLLYATNPQRYSEMAHSLGISPDRLAKAEVDYKKKDAAWTRLLQPHLRVP